jgi:Arc/MetJ family transcription regulator
MGRTNIEIDDELIARVMQRYGVRTKREAVDLALKRAAGEAMSREEALAMEGSGWDGDLMAMRSDRIDATWSADGKSYGEDRP